MSSAKTGVATAPISAATINDFLMLRSPGVNRGNAEALGLVPTEQRGDRNRWEAREIASDGQGTEFRVRRFLDSARTAPGLPAVPEPRVDAYARSFALRRLSDEPRTRASH